jgi:hypothetical protein
VAAGPPGSKAYLYTNVSRLFLSGGRPHPIPASPSRTSFIFYFGLEGMGGLELETDENENVSQQSTVKGPVQ